MRAAVDIDLDFSVNWGRCVELDELTTSVTGKLEWYFIFLIRRETSNEQEITL
jgi:hypothetical protein